MKEFYRDVASRVITNPSLAEINNSEAETLNSFPADEVVPVLQELFETSRDRVTRSRAFDALLKIQDLTRSSS